MSEKAREFYINRFNEHTGDMNGWFRFAQQFADEQLMSFVSFIKEHEEWEANLIKDSSCWESEYPEIKNEHFDKMMELQSKRNAILNYLKQRTNGK